VARWLCRQVEEVTGDFLTVQLRGHSVKSSLPVGQCEVEPGRFVFAIPRPIVLPEEIYKKQLIKLREQLTQMHIPGLAASFYPWGVSYPYARLHRDFIAKGPGASALARHLVDRIRDALTASPYISRGHDALRENRLDEAVREFKDALLYAPRNPYLHKHLAEAYMLRGDFKSATVYCKKALELEPRYASAYCLLADCLSYQGCYDEALAEYERALGINSTRADFLIRYGITLASISSAQYKEAYKKLTKREPDRLPHQAAIEKLERAQIQGITPDETPEDERKRLAEYRYHRGFAHLQAGLLEEALEDFAAGRRLMPADLRLAQAYSYTLSLLHAPQNRSSLAHTGQTSEASSVSPADSEA